MALGELTLKTKLAMPRFVAKLVIRYEQGGSALFGFPGAKYEFIFQDGEVAGEVLEIQTKTLGVQQAVIQLTNSMNMEKGLRFRVRESGRTVGAGQILELLY